jgi:rhodanese-related sulfurtransferase
MIMSSLAGSTRLTFWSFVLVDGMGAAIWAALTMGSGMLFHREIAYLVVRLQEFGAIAVGVIAAALVAYIATKWWRRRRFYGRLRVARITADELHRLIADGERPVIVDLRTPLARDHDPRFVPGALIVDSADLARWLDQVPTDREVIFYCTCPNEAGAARVARTLIDLGYERVRPLLGGLDAWIAAGFELQTGSVTAAAGASRVHAISHE